MAGAGRKRAIRGQLMRQLGERTNHGSSWESEWEAGVYCSSGSVGARRVGSIKAGLARRDSSANQGGSKQTQQHTGATRRKERSMAAKGQ